MKKTKLSHFDTKDTLVVISTYPLVDTSHGSYSAMDRYAQKKIYDIAKRRPVIMLAQYDTVPSTEISGKNIYLARIWKKGDLMSIFSITGFLQKLINSPTVLVEFEFNVFGGTTSNLALLLVLMILRISGKRIVFELHQVVTDFKKLTKHLGIHSKMLGKIYDIGLKVYYLSLGLICHHIIVLEEGLKEKLSEYMPVAKITALPHHMAHEKTIVKKSARKLANINASDFVFMVFGYLNHYKGVDWIVKNAKKIHIPGSRLLVAGGPNPYHVDKDYYKEYFESILKEVNNNKNITYTGFVPEDKISIYFSMSDLVVMPYRVFMAASGPFSIALSMARPVILSSALKGYMKSPDFRSAMEKSLLTEDELFFSLDQTSLGQLLKKFKNDNNYRKKLMQFSKTLAESRSFSSTYSRFDSIISGAPAMKSEDKSHAVLPVAISA